MRNAMTTLAIRWIAALAGCALTSCASESRVEPAVIESRPVEAVGTTEPSHRLTRISGIMDGNSLAWGPEMESCISGNGKYVAFLGKVGTALFSTESAMQLFIYDVDAGTTEQVKLECEGEELTPVNRKPRLSYDGWWVAFLTAEDYWAKPDENKAFICEWPTGSVLPLDVHKYGVPRDRGPESMDFSDDMSHAVIQLAAATWPAVCMLIDRMHDEGYVLRPQSGERALQASVSADGRFVAFLNSPDSDDPSIQARHLWLHDLKSDGYEELPLERWADAEALERLVLVEDPRVSRSGRYITLCGSPKFRTPWNSNSPPTTSVLLVDRSAEIVTVVTRGQDGKPADAPCYQAVPSEAGNCVVFVSHASNLVADDTNNNFDIFRYDCGTRRTECISANSRGQPGNDWSFDCDASDDGGSVVFWSRASNLVPDDRNKTPDIFLWQR